MNSQTHWDRLDALPDEEIDTFDIPLVTEEQFTRSEWHLPRPVPVNRGDAYFTDAQQARLQDLKSRQAALTEEERTEQEELIASAFDATIARIQASSLVKS